MVKNCSKVYKGRFERDSVDGETAQDRKLNWKHLVGASNFDGDSHRELFELVFWRVFVLLDQVLRASNQDGSIRPEFEPNFKLIISLNVAQSGVELKVRLEIFGEEQLDLHGVG